MEAHLELLAMTDRNSGRYDDGVKDLVRALRYIDVQPVMY